MQWRRFSFVKNDNRIAEYTSAGFMYLAHRETGGQRTMIRSFGCSCLRLSQVVPGSHNDFAGIGMVPLSRHEARAGGKGPRKKHAVLGSFEKEYSTIEIPQRL